MTTPAIAHRQKLERQIVELIVYSAISKGYSVSVDYNDGDDEKPIERSTDATEILKHTMATDEENLIFHRPNGSYVGFVSLVYGNDGWDAISNSSLNDETNAILAPAERFADATENDEAETANM